MEKSQIKPDEIYLVTEDIRTTRKRRIQLEKGQKVKVFKVGTRSNIVTVIDIETPLFHKYKIHISQLKAL